MIRDEDISIAHISQCCLFIQTKSIYFMIVCFCNVACRIDRAWKQTHDAAIVGLFICRKSNGLKKIERTIGTRCGGRTHCSGQNNGFFSRNRQIKKISGFFNRVGSVSNDDSVNVRTFCLLVNGIAQFYPVSFVHFVWIDRNERNHFNFSQIINLRNGLQNIADVNRTCTIFCCATIFSASGNRATGSNYDNFFHLLLGEFPIFSNIVASFRNTSPSPFLLVDDNADEHCLEIVIIDWFNF